MLEFRMRPRLALLILPLFSVLFGFGCKAAFQPARQSWPRLPNGYFMHVGAFLQVTGTGKSATGSKEESREKAIVDAWDRLLGYIERLPLPGYGYVKVKAKENPEFAKQLREFVYTAQVVETRRSGTVTAVVIRIGKSQINQFLETDFK